MTDLAVRIREQLDAIPHTPTCLTMCGSRTQTVYGEWPLACDCSRGERIAEAVARALHEAWRYNPYDRNMDGVMRALSSPSPEQEST